MKEEAVKLVSMRSIVLRKQNLNHWIEVLIKDVLLHFFFIILPVSVADDLLLPWP